VIRILDLYCGMGGLSLGLVLAINGAKVLGELPKPEEWQLPYFYRAFADYFEQKIVV